MSNENFYYLDRVFNQDNYGFDYPNYAIADLLIDLYYLKNEKKWYEDKNFKTMIFTFVDEISFSDNNSKYKVEYEKYLNLEEFTESLSIYLHNLEQNIRDEYDIENNLAHSYLSQIIDNKVYYIVEFDIEDSRKEAYMLELDNETMTIKGHKKIDN